MYYGERFNSITHLVGAALSLMGLGALVTVGVNSGNTKLLVSYTIFGFSMVLLYTMSTLYHSFHPVSLKRLFRKLDHIAIYILIAGTYTPYLLVALKENKGIWILTFVWTMAVIGICLDIFKRNRNETSQICIYLLACCVYFLR